MSDSDKQDPKWVPVVGAGIPILIGAAILFFTYMGSQQPTMCGGTEMNSKTDCRRGSSIQSKEEKESTDNRGTIVGVIFGLLFIGGGVLLALADRKPENAAASGPPARTPDRTPMPSPVSNPAPTPFRAPLPPPAAPLAQPAWAQEPPQPSFRPPLPPTPSPPAPISPAAQTQPVLADTEFPTLPVMWSRWTTIAATLVAIRSEVGPRISSATTATFEGTTGSGSTLRRLPRDRAVFSGGAIEHTPTHPLAGAPEWITNSVLNTRVHNAHLNFCYWWDGGHWYRTQSPDARLLFTAVPGIWTDNTVSEVVADLVTHRPNNAIHQAVSQLLTAAAHSAVTRAHVENVFGGSNLDVNGAYTQFALAELTAP